MGIKTSDSSMSYLVVSLAWNGSRISHIKSIIMTPKQPTNFKRVSAETDEVAVHMKMMKFTQTNLFFFQTPPNTLRKSQSITSHSHIQ